MLERERVAFFGAIRASYFWMETTGNFRVAAPGHIFFATHMTESHEKNHLIPFRLKISEPLSERRQ